MKKEAAGMSFYGQDEAASRVEPRIRVFVPHRLCLEVCEGFLHTGRIFEKGLGTGSFFSFRIWQQAETGSGAEAAQRRLCSICPPLQKTAC